MSMGSQIIKGFFIQNKRFPIKKEVTISSDTAFSNAKKDFIIELYDIYMKSMIPLETQCITNVDSEKIIQELTSTINKLEHNNKELEKENKIIADKLQIFEDIEAQKKQEEYDTWARKIAQEIKQYLNLGNESMENIRQESKERMIRFFNSDNVDITPFLVNNAELYHKYK
jgi:hypothetical protein